VSKGVELTKIIGVCICLITCVRKVLTGIVPLLKRLERCAVNSSRPWSRCVIKCGGRQWRSEEASGEAIRRRCFSRAPRRDRHIRSQDRRGRESTTLIALSGINALTSCHCGMGTYS
jgi:hypothetical protein